MESRTRKKGETHVSLPVRADGGTNRSKRGHRAKRPGGKTRNSRATSCAKGGEDNYVEQKKQKGSDPCDAGAEKEERRDITLRRKRKERSPCSDERENVQGYKERQHRSQERRKVDMKKTPARRACRILRIK